MDTGPIKNFAQELRNQLREGVKQRLLYWGFNEKGEVKEKPEPVEGGYTFRGEVFSDETVAHRWKQLKRMINIHDVDYIIEEGAYTWFNRLVAIRILEKNNYIQPQLEYEGGTNLPYLLQNARRGIFPDMQDKELDELKKQLRENKDNEAFARLLTHYCDSQPLISNIFGKISYREDYTELLLPQNLLDQQGILDFIVSTDAITDEDFEQVELIGWLYQFYITEKKDEVFKSFKKRKKAGPEEIPAATQIFTPEWIVRYMVENTVGRLWMDLHPDSDLIGKMDYYVKPSDENPKAEPIIKDVTDLTLLDPAAGSGHILVVGFEYLMEMYREEGYTARQSVESILHNNVYGLEIDERAAQLARFAVLLKAAKYDKAVLDGDQQPQIHSFPERTNISTAELREFLGEEGEEYVDEFRDALKTLQQGKKYGSILNLDISSDAIQYAKKRMADLTTLAMEDLAIQDLRNKIGPFINVMELLQKGYEAVAANPPYLSSRNMNGDLKNFLKKNYKKTKKDLFAVFQEVLISLGCKGAKRGIINQWAWMCIDSYKDFRKKFLKECSVDSLLHLGIGVFKELNTKKVQNVALVFDDNKKNAKKTVCYKLDETFKNKQKEKLFFKGKSSEHNLNELLKIPGSPIAFWLDEELLEEYSKGKILDKYISPKQGLATGKNAKFIRNWYEVDFNKIYYGASDKQEAKKSGKKWFPYNKGGGFKRWYGNEFFVINWKNDGYALKNFTDSNGRQRSVIRNEDFYFKEGITWSLISLDFSARYSSEGHIFDVGGSSGFPPQNLIYYSLALLNSKISSYLLGALNFTLNVQVGDIKRILFIEPNSSKEKIDSKTKKLVSLSKEEFNSSEISKDFSRHNLLEFSQDKIENIIVEYFQQLVTKLKDYYRLEYEINEELIRLYGLEEELSPNPKYKLLTFYQDVFKDVEKAIKKDIANLSYHEVIDVEYVLKSFISYAIGCMMGRFSLYKGGLKIASRGYDKSQLKGEESWIDEDGIIPLFGKNSPFSDGIVYRTENFIGNIWGEEILTKNLNYFNKYLGDRLEKFLIDGFWEFHVSMYDKKPIYWLFSSKNGAFKVLSYMHRMDKYTVQKVRQNYLHPYMDYLRKEIEKLDTKNTLNSDEAKRLDRLRSDLNECLEYDDVIKEVADKQIDFDLDDGVQDNYELFGKALAKI